MIKLSTKQKIGIRIIFVLTLLSFGFGISFLLWALYSTNLIIDNPDYPYQIQESSVPVAKQKLDDAAKWSRVKQDTFSIGLPPDWKVFYSKTERQPSLPDRIFGGFSDLGGRRNQYLLEGDKFLSIVSPDYEGQPSEDHQIFNFAAGQEVSIRHCLPVAPASIKDIDKKDYSKYGLDYTGVVLRFFDIDGVPAVEKMDTRDEILVIKDHIPYLIVFSFNFYKSGKNEDQSSREKHEQFLEYVVSTLRFE